MSEAEDKLRSMWVNQDKHRRDASTPMPRKCNICDFYGPSVTGEEIVAHYRSAHPEAMGAFEAELQAAMDAMVREGGAVEITDPDGTKRYRVLDA